MRAALRMRDRLRARGVESATADELAAELTARLAAAEDPQDAAEFLDALVAAEPPSAERRSRFAALRRLPRLLRRRMGGGAPATAPDEKGTS
ncbi:hypothetical protein [Streptomyces sp. NPDC090445]|uniref:hypothetical protein n=1 Tax=Streptomyces sp. NPDC090445 TaxID=3365963 RepID=UPI003817ECD3